MSFGYPYEQGPDMWVDIFGANGGDVFLRDQANAGRAVCHDVDGYRTVCSAVIFGALSQERRADLMAEYVDFLTLGTGTAEPHIPQPADARCLVEPNPVNLGGRVRFALGPGVDAITVFDATGRTIVRRGAAAGRASWDLRGRDGSLVTPGTYFVRASGRVPSETRPLVVVR